MRHFLIQAVIAAVLCTTSSAQVAPSNPILAPPAPPVVSAVPAPVQAAVGKLQASALRSDLAWDITESLTTEIGARLAGSENEARAREWAVEKLRELGFQNVRVEPFTIPYWRRTVERASVMTRGGEQAFVVVALGGSGATPTGGIEAEVVRFESVAEFAAASEESVRGKIVFIDERMVRAQDGSGYGPAVAKRSQCAPHAARKGAQACVIRSVGTDSHRFAHQGGSARQAGGLRFPAAAISAPDADQLARLMKRGGVRMKLEIGVEVREDAPSGNVIGEIVGREAPHEVVLIGGHIDSWDQGTGAIDDGAGVAITMAAARLVKDLPRRPRRTIRVVLFGAEETGVHGGAAYARAHDGEAQNIMLAAESDFGAGRIWKLEGGVGVSALPHIRAMHHSLRPLGIILGGNGGNGGADVGALHARGVPVVDLAQDGTDYFDYHHTPDDTLDKIDPAALRQNVAAWATVTYLAAEMDWSFRDSAAVGAPPVAR